jgi:benzoyl-CoA reductase subunit C
VLPVEEHTAMLDEYAGRASPTPSAARWTRRACCSRGRSASSRRSGLIKTLERAGCYIVDDDFVQVLALDHAATRPAGRVTRCANLVDAAFLHDAIAQPDRATSTERREGRALVDACAAERRRGRVFCAPSFCDPALLDQPMPSPPSSARASRGRVQVRREHGQFQVIREQAGTFADSIKLWSGVEA